jgi:hypothetical protein
LPRNLTEETTGETGFSCAFPGGVRDDGEVRVRLAEPDYQLVVPGALFTASAVKLLNQWGLSDGGERCELLLDDAFVRGYEGGPLSEFRQIAVADSPWGTSASHSSMTAKHQFLWGDLLGKGDQLQEDASHCRRYWRERETGQRAVVVLDNAAVARVHRPGEKRFSVYNCRHCGFC